MQIIQIHKDEDGIIGLGDNGYLYVLREEIVEESSITKVYRWWELCARKNTSKEGGLISKGPKVEVINNFEKDEDS